MHRKGGARKNFLAAPLGYLCTAGCVGGDPVLVKLEAFILKEQFVQSIDHGGKVERAMEEILAL